MPKAYLACLISLFSLNYGICRGLLLSVWGVLLKCWLSCPRSLGSSLASTQPNRFTNSSLVQFMEGQPCWALWGLPAGSHPYVCARIPWDVDKAFCTQDPLKKEGPSKIPLASNAQQVDSQPPTDSLSAQASFVDATSGLRLQTWSHLVRVKIVEVVCWQSSSLPVIQSYSSVSIANEIQLVIGSFEVGRVGTVPNIHCIYQVISWETSFLGRLQPTFQWGTLSNCKLCPHQHESFKSIAKSHHCQQKQSHMAHKTSRQMSEGQSGSQNCNYLWCTTYLPTNSRSTWKPSDVIETGHTGCEVCSCKYWKVEAWKGMNKLPALINFLP